MMSRLMRILSKMRGPTALRGVHVSVKHGRWCSHAVLPPLLLQPMHLHPASTHGS